MPALTRQQLVPQAAAPPGRRMEPDAPASTASHGEARAKGHALRCLLVHQDLGLAVDLPGCCCDERSLGLGPWTACRPGRWTRWPAWCLQ
jgi:hypothetical protein